MGIAELAMQLQRSAKTVQISPIYIFKVHLLSHVCVGVPGARLATSYGERATVSKPQTCIAPL